MERARTGEVRGAGPIRGATVSEQFTLFPDQSNGLADRRLKEIERKRLSRQCVLILLRLLKGPVVNTELNVIAFRYSARIGEIRNAGVAVDIIDRDHETGVVTYQLREDLDNVQLAKSLAGAS